MKKLLKRVLVVVLSLSLVTNFNLNHTKVYAFGDTDIKPMLWPGRPGGNGDGSEEYMNGLKYGEMRGPWVHIRTESGNVYDLQDNTSKMGVISGIIIGAIAPGLGIPLLGTVFGGAMTLASLLPRNTAFDDAKYYIARSYGSGRRLKVEYELYDYQWRYLRKVVNYLDF